MMAREGCTEFRELAPELALGIADGEERAAALEHLAGCPDCRRYLDELSTTADELLVLAPEREPPLGFESRVLAEIHPPPLRRRRRWRPVRIAAVACAGALVAAAAMFLAYRDDHRLASHYRDTLAEANGDYFTAAAVQAPNGATVGQAFGYQGHPSWMVVTVSAPDGGVRDGTYDCQIVTDDGRRMIVGPLQITGGEGSWGHAIPVAFESVSQLRMLGPRRGAVLESSF
jgi:Putative zinc-finger